MLQLCSPETFSLGLPYIGLILVPALNFIYTSLLMLEEVLFHPPYREKDKVLWMVGFFFLGVMMYLGQEQ